MRAEPRVPRAARPLILILILAGLLGAGNEAYAQSRKGRKTLVIGKISSNPKKHFRYLQPMVDYVAAQMADLGIEEGKVLMAKDHRQLSKYLRRGQVDWVTESVFPALILKERAGAEILLKKWKKGVSEYRSIVIVRKDSGIRSIADLVGRKIAFEDPTSTTAFFLPAMDLIKAGLTVEELFSAREECPEGAVGYVFARQEVNIALWVHKGIVDAGAYSDGDWTKDDHTPPKLRQELEIIHESDPYPRALELVRRDLDPRIKQRLKVILLESGSKPSARTVLNLYQRTKKFEELSEEDTKRIEKARKILYSVRASMQ